MRWACPVHSWVKWSVDQLQHNFGVEFNRFGDGVTISRPWQQRAENQQVPSPLQQLDALVVDILGEVIVRPVECQGERYSEWLFPLEMPRWIGIPAITPGSSPLVSNASRSTNGRIRGRSEHWQD